MDQPVTLITGAGRGIGRATAEVLAKRGYRLALLARNEAELRETQRRCGEALLLPVDVTDPASVERAMSQVVETCKRIDAVVHCAGLAPVRSIVETTIEEWQAVLNTNLSAAFYLARAAWPYFVRQGGGVMVNISSAAARDPFAGFAAYGAAKAGVNLFGLAAAREGHKAGIRVHTIAPSAVETGMFRQILSPAEYPTERTLLPKDVAEVIARCVTGELRHTSGEVIYLHQEPQ